MSGPRTLISILNWNNAPDTVQCIESLRESGYLERQDIEVHVVDNASRPEDREHLKRYLDTQPVVQHFSPRNTGFAGGHNIVLRHALACDCDYVWLLNNDAVIEPGCLDRLLAHADAHPQAGLISPVIKDKHPPHAYQHVLSLLNAGKTGVTEHKDLDEARRLQQQSPHQVILWGTALLIRKSLIAKIGLLDEQLFAYAEDTDYSIRSLKHGFLNEVVFDAAILHEAPPPPRKPHYYYYTQRNYTLMTRKHASALNMLRLIRWNLHLARRQLESFADRKDLSDSLKLGLWHGWTNHGGEYDSRRRLSPAARRIVDLLLHIA